MKATNTTSNNILKSLIIIVSIFCIPFTTVLAGNDNYSHSAVSTVNNLIQILAPARPETCDFNDAELNIADVSNLAPVVPSEADFNDESENTCDIAAPVTIIPAEADFSDANLENYNITSLAPVTPVEAYIND